MDDSLHSICSVVAPRDGHGLPISDPGVRYPADTAYEWDVVAGAAGAARHPTSEEARKLEAYLRERHPTADVAVLPAATRRKGVLVCDMDSTLIGQECIDELAEFAGVGDRVRATTERAMRGEIGFEDALRERVASLAGLAESVLEECYRTRITLNPGARTLARTMAEAGATTVVVSGGFTFFADRVAEACGFAHAHANVLEIEDGVLTGRVVEPILGREAKLETLLRYSDNDPSRACVIGDGANDLAMIQAAGMGIAYRAKPIVAEAARYRIDHTDLTTALIWQGYGQSEFVDDDFDAARKLWR